MARKYIEHHRTKTAKQTTSSYKFWYDHAKSPVSNSPDSCRFTLELAVAETDIALENWPSQKEMNHFPTSDFQRRVVSFRGIHSGKLT